MLMVRAYHAPAPPIVNPMKEMSMATKKATKKAVKKAAPKKAVKTAAPKRKK